MIRAFGAHCHFRTQALDANFLRRRLGITFPITLLGRADEVIE